MLYDFRLLKLGDAGIGGDGVPIKELEHAFGLLGAAFPLTPRAGGIGALLPVHAPRLLALEHIRLYQWGLRASLHRLEGLLAVVLDAAPVLIVGNVGQRGDPGAAALLLGDLLLRLLLDDPVVVLRNLHAERKLVLDLLLNLSQLAIVEAVLLLFFFLLSVELLEWVDLGLINIVRDDRQRRQLLFVARSLLGPGRLLLGNLVADVSLRLYDQLLVVLNHLLGLSDALLHFDASLAHRRLRFVDGHVRLLVHLLRLVLGLGEFFDVVAQVLASGGAPAAFVAAAVQR